MGNAVAPPVAAALGRCLLMAAEGKAPVGVPVVFTPDPEYEAAVAAARAKGQRFWIEENELPNVSVKAGWGGQAELGYGVCFVLFCFVRGWVEAQAGW
jgi:hypothetical protein